MLYTASYFYREIEWASFPFHMNYLISLKQNKGGVGSCGLVVISKALMVCYRCTYKKK